MAKVPRQNSDLTTTIRNGGCHEPKPNQPRLTRRSLLQSGAAFGGIIATGMPLHRAFAAAPIIKVDTHTIEVNKKAAKVFRVLGADGKSGIFAKEGDRFAGSVLNASGEPLQMHWHGQVKAPFDQDRARPGGGACAADQSDTYDFELTPGTHWMHSHTLSEQQMLAAPMITREKDAGDVQDVVVMLHDFAFRSPQEILAELGGTNAHAGHGAAQSSAPMSGGAAPMQHGAGMHMMPGQGSARAHDGRRRYGNGDPCQRRAVRCLSCQ